MSFATDLAADAEVERFVRERWLDYRGTDWLRRVNALAIRADYLDWSGDPAGRRLTTRAFNRSMRRIGFDRPPGSRCWYGIGERDGGGQ